MTSWIVFGVLAAGMAYSGIRVVTCTDLVRSVLWLAVTLLLTAVLYVTLHADFIATVQVLLYTGGVVTLMLFAVMLTERLETARVEHHSRSRAAALVAAVALLGTIGWAVRTAFPTMGAPPPELVPDTALLGKMFLTQYLLPFEVLSVLLLAAMIGAITIARRTDP